jgi:hypothetical protein
MREGREGTCVFLLSMPLVPSNTCAGCAGSSAQFVPIDRGMHGGCHGFGENSQALLRLLWEYTLKEKAGLYLSQYLDDGFASRNFQNLTTLHFTVSKAQRNNFRILRELINRCLNQSSEVISK